ncbi:hypothetical protein RUND412_004418 [Rhizina undulata]
MRRAQRVRRTRSQSGPFRGQQHQRRGARHRSSDQNLEPVIPPTASPDPPLRRSARLNRGVNQSVVAGRSAEAEVTRQRRRRQDREERESRGEAEASENHQGSLNSVIPIPEPEGQVMNSTNHSTDGMADGNRDRTYSLEIVVQPPRVTKVGVPMYPPLALRVHIHDAASEVEMSGEDELSNLFAQAALYGESGNLPPLAPPDMFLLSGRLSMSLDLLNETVNNGAGEHERGDTIPLREQEGSYVIFPDLTIHRTGNYRIGVSLFKVGDRMQARSVSAGSSVVESQGGGTSLAEVKSDVIMVQENAVPIQIELEAQEFLNHIRERGANVPSPPSPA